MLASDCNGGRNAWQAMDCLNACVGLQWREERLASDGLLVFQWLVFVFWAGVRECLRRTGGKR